MTIKSIINFLETVAPPAYQESYDNCGLIIGNKNAECCGILCALDVTEAVIAEAKQKNCNLIVAHHPLIFRSIKKINGNNYVEKTVIAAIKNDIAVYAIHTNLDNLLTGVNAAIADKLNLQNRKILLPKQNVYTKLFTFVPTQHAQKIKDALFAAGAGNIGNYSECSFSVSGQGSFKAGNHARPFVGEKNIRHHEAEEKIEVIFPTYLQHPIIETLLAAHPYEEVAYDLAPLSNAAANIGSGILGELKNEMSEVDFFQLLKTQFSLTVIKHTPLLNKKIKKVAVCGGSGSFLIRTAIAAGADFYVTADVKYHEFFDAENKLVFADIGHWESEQFTPNLLVNILSAKFTTFAVLKSEANTNPVRYFV
jgi:dinuclear metal center YbgI/SA1388 family protein